MGSSINCKPFNLLSCAGYQHFYLPMGGLQDIIYNKPQDPACHQPSIEQTFGGSLPPHVRARLL